MIQIFKKIYITLITLIYSGVAFSRDIPTPTRGQDPNPCSPGQPCPQGPIDDYLPLLFFAALLLGVWALNRLNNKKLVKVKS